jgi:hypothetical protein
MLNKIQQKQVDNFGILLNQELVKISNEGVWGSEFVYEHASYCHYSSARQGSKKWPRREKWCQLNDPVYEKMGYSSECEDGTIQHWKLQARFSAGTPSDLWLKKKPSPENRQPREWSLAGSDVWGISYDALSEALQALGQEKLLEMVLEDLQMSWRTIGRQVPVKS